ncbi:amidohydrolase family protein [Gordonia polyisoprenivorans]|uniref:amidohydrolase family protein n=1 Tax=Gordonia polyisoprenivorans TaxID=84595 RepID=UPI002301ECCF|nr:amidohydrolase family protein [Gordonia polyisoprenivorans]WCB37359.1 amidohydrolase family protein [Gordonia polyisoprenivorans]
MSVAAAGRIDVHAHYFGGAVADLIAGRGPGGPDRDRWTADTALDVMAEFDITAQILSLPFTPMATPDDPGFATRFARQVNEDYAELIATHPGRFGAFAVLPGTGADDMLDEIGYALDTLHLDGIALNSNIGGHYLGSEFMEPVLAELNRRRTPVFIHPTDCAHAAELALGRPRSVIEFPFDTARNIVNALYTGVFHRHPNLVLILPHCGGPLPSLSWRISEHTTVAIGPDDTPITPQHVADMLARLYYDTAMAGAPVSLLPTLQITDISHVLFGTDWPAAPEPTVARTIDQLVHAGLTADELHAIEYGNTAKLLSRFG